MGNGVETAYFDLSVGLVFVVIGLILILLDVVFSVGNGLDLIFIGSAFILGGLVTWPFNSWVLTVLVIGAICIGYVILGRRYVNRWAAVSKSKTNVDAVIGRTGIVLSQITRNFDGLVKVDHEDWRARSDAEFEAGEEITVLGVSGVTLIVKKTGGTQN